MDSSHSLRGLELQSIQEQPLVTLMDEIPRFLMSPASLATRYPPKGLDVMSLCESSEQKLSLSTQAWDVAMSAN